MAKAMKICRVCGKEYEACHTLKPSVNIYRWQDVACSPECGAEYFAKIEASRSNTYAKKAVVEEVCPEHKENIGLIESEELSYEIDSAYDEDEDDDEYYDEDEESDE